MLAEANRARSTLETRIGPRGLLLGHLALPSGQQLPIWAASPDAAKKIFRRLRLGPAWTAERASIVAEVRAACRRWDAEAERAGLYDLTRQATEARDSTNRAAVALVADMESKPA